MTKQIRQPGEREASDRPLRYCRRCNYPLIEAEFITQCTRCRFPIDHEDPSTYQTSLPLLFWKFWLPAFFVSVASGVIAYGVCLTAWGEMGIGLFIGVPISFGAIFGYASRIGFVLKLFVGIGIVLSVVLALTGGGFAGPFCGMTLAAIFVIPAMAGIAIGNMTRHILREIGYDEFRILPLLCFAAWPYAIQTIESRYLWAPEFETVATTLTLNATADQAWDAILFYEEVEHSPPLLLRLALPIPERSVGSKTNVGEIVRCVYDRGYIVKRIQRIDAGTRLEFEVIEQKLHFERDITLVGGSFQLLSTSDSETQVTLTTRYERHLRPKWLWFTIEHKVIRTLHQHVLGGMRQRVIELKSPATPLEAP